MHRFIRRLGLLGTVVGYFLHPRKGARRRARVMWAVDRVGRRVGLPAQWLPMSRASRAAAR